MRITRLVAENFKRLKAVSITPDGGPVVKIQGQNGEGKTSALDAIAAVLGGKALCPEQPIRRGEKEARAQVHLAEGLQGLVAERRWWRAGDEVRTELEVREKEGDAPKKSPQKVLDALVGALTFDPLAYQRMKPEQQLAALREITGVDTTALDTRRRNTYEARTAANRTVDQLKARLGSTPPVDAPDEPTSGADLLAEQQKRSDTLTAQNAKRQDLETFRGRYRAQDDEVERLRKLVADSEAELAKFREKHAAAVKLQEEMRAQGANLRAEIDALVPPNMEEIPAKLKELEATNEKVLEKRKRAAVAAELKTADAEASKLDGEIKAIDELIAATIAKAKFPVQGLGLGESGITFNGLPFEQASAAEQLRVSLAMGAALNPKLRIMLIRDASLLDKKSLAAVTEYAEKQDLQVWLEVVTEGRPSGIVIEDGTVVGAT